MATWRLKIHRYNDRSESRISGAHHINADDFGAACVRANDIVTGMQYADPESRFSVVSLDTFDYRGTDCEGGIFPFETKDECSARIAAKVEPK